VVVVRKRTTQRSGWAWELGEERKQKGVGRAPADLHAPLNKTG